MTKKSKALSEIVLGVRKPRTIQPRQLCIIESFPPFPGRLRLHVDFAGPVKGKMLMEVIHAHSKWPGIFIMENTTTEETINTIHSLLARLGLPHQIVSDNGPQFTLGVFKSFVKENGIRRDGRTLPSGNQFTTCTIP